MQSVINCVGDYDCNRIKSTKPEVLQCTQQCDSQQSKVTRYRGNTEGKEADVIKEDLCSCNVSADDTSNRAKWKEKTRNKDPTTIWEQCKGERENIMLYFYFLIT
uniref:Uncharacterized protein n=1 Tax=Pectinophora gossypiella TaxID=13191 RepID=A0A1E1WBD3_PECGO